MAPTGPEALRAAGLRATRPRLAVLEVLDQARARREHLPAAEVALRARGLLGAVSVQATYDCLDALVLAGLARRIRPAGAASAVYEFRVGDNHHHVVCRGCGATADVDCAVGAAPCLVPSAPALPTGFVLDEAEVVLWGWCAACAAARGTAPPRPDVPSPNPAPEEEQR